MSPSGVEGQRERGLAGPVKCECRRPRALAALAPAIPLIHGQGPQRQSKQGYPGELVAETFESPTSCGRDASRQR